MGSFASTMSLLPGRNPTGIPMPSDYSTSPQTGATSGSNPILATPNPGTNAPVTNNPYGGGSVPVFGANSGPYSSTNLTGSGPGYGPGNTTLGGAQSGAMGSLLSGMTQGGLNDLYHELNKTYGEGGASALMSFLLSGAGFNQDAINNLFASLQPQIERGTESIMNQFSTMGDRFGSDAQIGLGDYLSQVNLNEGQLETQMYESSVSNYINTLLGVTGRSSTRIANSPGVGDTLSSIMSGIGGAGSAGQGLSSLISAIAPNADTTLLDTIAGAAAGFA